MSTVTRSIIRSFEKYISILNLETVSNDYEYYYRGCSVYDWKYNLTPSIYRDNQIIKEDIKFREMILRSPNDFLNEKTTLEKLVKMQHYALPTRLLDITTNPLVALYFACQQYKNRKVNGIVYVFKIRKEEIKYYDSDAVCLISNLSRLSIDKTDFSDGDFGYLMHEIREEKPYFMDTFVDANKEDIKKIFPVKVKLNNNRIVSQSGAFFIFGMRNLSSKKKPVILPPYNIGKKLIIKKEFKEGFRHLLDSLAINENTLFPELEHQANYLVR